jgi:hypothetical protein
VPVSSLVRERVRRLLPPGEEIGYIFPAIGGSQNLPVAQFFVVVTDASITVFHGGFWSRNRPKEVWRRFARNTRLGPVDTNVISTFTLGGLTFEVDDEYVSVIHAADAEIDSAQSLPQDPLPDL